MGRCGIRGRQKTLRFDDRGGVEGFVAGAASLLFEPGDSWDLGIAWGFGVACWVVERVRANGML